MQVLEIEDAPPSWSTSVPVGSKSRSRLLPTALLVLLAEQESHGYDLALRLCDLGLASDLPAIYRSLRSMDRRGLVRSDWDTSPRGPARRVYGLTDEGWELLSSSVAAMEEAWLNMSRLLSRSRRVVEPEYGGVVAPG